MVETLPNGRLVEVPGVGHAPVLTEPVAVKALDEFLAG
jgi:pimeloyl-ACP methyl ester carboxylesterase